MVHEIFNGRKIMHLKRLSRSSGFTLIEIMIAVGLLTVAALGVASMAVLMLRSSNSYKSEVGAITLRGSIQEALKTAQSCQTLMSFPSGFDPVRAATADGVPVQINLPGTGLIVQSATVPSLDLNIGSLQFSNAISAGVNANGNRLYYGMININASKVSTESLGSQQMRGRMVASVIIETNAANVFVGCNLQMTANDICSQMGGVLASGTCDFKALYPPSSCPPGEFAQGILADGRLLCVAPKKPQFKFPNKSNPCDDAVTLTYFKSTCNGADANPGDTCTWYGPCGRFDGGSKGNWRTMSAAGYTLIDLPGDRYPATKCTGSNNEDGFACMKHIEASRPEP
jgi:prepilin-type N-terminal cleavage/methylation domain-containing protein